MCVLEKGGWYNTMQSCSLDSKTTASYLILGRASFASALNSPQCLPSTFPTPARVETGLRAIWQPLPTKRVHIPADRIPDTLLYLPTIAASGCKTKPNTDSISESDYLKSSFFGGRSGSSAPRDAQQGNKTSNVSDDDPSLHRVRSRLQLAFQHFSSFRC